jgi:hypothetical protein
MNIKHKDKLKRETHTHTKEKKTPKMEKRKFF